MKNLLQLEKRIKSKMNGIREGEFTPTESKIGVLLNVLKGVDEVSYEKHITDYKEVLKDIKK